MSKIKNTLVAFGFLFAIFVFTPLVSHAQGGKPTAEAASTSSVKGSGTPGRITKWVGNSNPSVDVSDSIIAEDNLGQIGIGTTTPTSTLTVAGMVETTLGGYKFPDGSVQTTAALVPGQTVTSLNGLTDNVTLAAGANITITPTGNTLTIASTATDPAKNAFQSEVLIGISIGAISGAREISVPFNKRLVIEYIAIKAVGDEPFNTVDINALLGSTNTIFQILPIPAVGRISAVDKQVRIYSDGDISMVATLVKEATNDTSVRVTVSGYLVDRP